MAIAKKEEKPQKGEKSEASIIEIIQDMVKEGEPETQIIQTLKDLGVQEDKAKRLLLIGQADTFALLRAEISKIVLADVEKEKPKLLQLIEDEAEKAKDVVAKKVEEKATADLKEYEKYMENQSTMFQSQINDSVRKVTDLSDRVREKLNELGERLRQVEVDMDEMKLKGVGTRHRIISILLVVLGIFFCMSTLYLFFTSFNGIISVDSVIITIAMAFVGVSMLFVATLI
jgi:hypothetical protein